MKPSSAALASILQPVPDELLRYFEQASDAGMYTQARHSQHLLRPEDAASHTHLIRYHPIVEVLGGIVLDDMQTSNHHLYISVGPLCGAVFFLSHDGDSRVVYSSLPTFLAAAVSACDQEQILEDIHPAHSPMASDQPGLSAWITDLLTLEQADVLVLDSDNYLGRAAKVVDDLHRSAIRAVAGSCRPSFAAPTGHGQQLLCGRVCCTRDLRPSRQRTHRDRGPVYPTLASSGVACRPPCTCTHSRLINPTSQSMIALGGRRRWYAKPSQAPFHGLCIC